MSNYELLLNRLEKNPIHPLFRAVHLFSADSKWVASGTLVLSKNGQHRGIFTVSHLFANNSPQMRIFYQVLQPYSPVTYSIGEVNEVFGYQTGGDVALCIPGPAQIVGGFSRHLKDPTNPTGSLKKSFTVEKQPHPDCISLTTNKVVPVLGVAKDGLDGYYVLQYQSCPGESGTGFIKSPNEIYVLSTRAKLEIENRKLFNIPEDITEVTFATSICIN